MEIIVTKQSKTFFTEESTSISFNDIKTVHDIDEAITFLMQNNSNEHINQNFKIPEQCKQK